MWFDMTGPRPMQPLLFLLLGDGVGSGACCNHGCRSQRKVRFVRCVTFIGFAVAAVAVAAVAVAVAAGRSRAKGTARARASGKERARGKERAPTRTAKNEIPVEILIDDDERGAFRDSAT